MSKKTAASFIILFTFFFAGCELPATHTGVAVKYLKAGWEEEIIYNHAMVYPTTVTLDGDGNILVSDTGKKQIVRVTPSGQISLYADVSSIPGAWAIAWQPKHKRLLIGTVTNSLYACTDGQLTILKPFGVNGGAFAVSSHEDSFYAADQFSICQFDADGNFKKTIANNLRSCFQIALDEVSNKLFYAEPRVGDIVEIDLTDNKQTIIASGVGIPGTAEPITLALDENNELYYFTANQGLNRFNGTSFDLVMNPATGAGQLLWIPQLKTFIVANGTGANIVSYNPVSRQTQNITPHINANAIVEMTDGTILVTTGDEIKKVTGTGFASFTEKFNGICTSLARDSSGNIYGGFPDGVIAKISAEGKITPWVSPGIIPDMVMGIHYDRKNDQLVVVSGRGGISSHADVWRLSINAPTTITPIAHFDGIMVHENLPAATVDYSGTVYILERTANVIYKIPDGTTESAVFANNVLSSEAITVPGLEYLSKENALVVSGVSDYYLWYLDKPQRSILAINNGAVDNFAMHENKDGNLVCIHSGQVFRLVQTSNN